MLCTLRLNLAIWYTCFCHLMIVTTRAITDCDEYIRYHRFVTQYITDLEEFGKKGHTSGIFWPGLTQHIVCNSTRHGIVYSKLHVDNLLLCH